jgi:recombination protein RecA
VTHAIVEKSGSWFSYSGERIGQGRENVRQYLKEHRDIYNRIDTELRAKLGLGVAKDVEIPPVPVNGSAIAHEAVTRPAAGRRPQTQ